MVEQQELKFKQDALSLYGIDRDRAEEYRSEYLEEREKNRLKKLVPFSRPTYEQLLKKSGEEFERNLETVQREFCERKFNITLDITKNINSQSKTSHRLSQSSQTQILLFPQYLTLQWRNLILNKVLFYYLYNL